MRAILGWLANRAFLYVLLFAAIGAALLLGPSLSTIAEDVGRENLSYAELQSEIAALRDARQAELEARLLQARGLSSAALAARIAARREARADAEARRDEASRGMLAPYRPSQILARKAAEIDIALLDRELAALAAAQDPRAALTDAEGYLAANPLVPTAGAVAAARARCTRAEIALQDFERRGAIDQALRETFRSEQSARQQARSAACAQAATLEQRRAAGLDAAKARRAAEARLASLSAAPLPQDFAADIARRTLADIAWQAFLALVAITLAPFAIRLVCWFVLAPMAEKWPPMRFAPDPVGSAPPPAAPSSVSLALTLGEGEEALVRQDFLQSTSLEGAKRTRWLLDHGRPVTSLASGMRFLTAISGAGERVTVSAVKDPFAELAMLSLPAGASAVVRPSALAALVQTEGKPTRITAHWRLFALPAWLTWQWRYLAFHGPVRLVLKGGRGVRIEPAEKGRIVGPGQVIGFSTDCAYSVIRSETFWPYFLGREELLKDRIEEGRGVVLLEEAPLAGRRGLRRGLEGAFDALLKLGGM